TGFADGTYTLILSVYDLAGNIGNASRTIIVDNAPPVVAFDSWTQTVNPQYQHVSGTRLFFNPNKTGSAELRIQASDGGTGVGGWNIERRSATLTNGSCGAYTLWGPVGGADPSTPFLDSGLSDATCYQYQLLVTDNVGNTTPANSTNELKVDRTRPTGAIN